MPPAGDKSESKALMTAAGVPVVPGYHGEDQTLDWSVPFLACVSACACPAPMSYSCACHCLDEAICGNCVPGNVPCTLLPTALPDMQTLCRLSCACATL